MTNAAYHRVSLTTGLKAAFPQHPLSLRAHGSGTRRRSFLCLSLYTEGLLVQASFSFLSLPPNDPVQCKRFGLTIRARYRLQPPRTIQSAYGSHTQAVGRNPCRAIFRELLLFKGKFDK